jgi:iron-sulfur cluster repair protein YtfE (RIC family)
MRPTRPSKVRALILRQHAEISASLAQLAGTVAPLAQDAASSAEASRLCRRLYAQLSEHLDLEDEVLVPALRETDAWGGLRADALIRHHQGQRQELILLVSTDGIEPSHLAERLMQLIEGLRQDMAQEERDILSADLLRDDVLAIAMEAG